LILDIRRERRLLSHTTDSFRSLWARFEADPPQIKLGTRDLTSDAMRRIQHLVPRSLPWLHVERAAIRDALADGPKAILLASDQHRIGSMVAAEANAAGIPSAVLQHGLPQHRVGYVPLAANRMLAWSEESKAWFVANGTDPHRIVVVGNPAFDQSRGVHHRSTQEGPLPTNVLLALTPSTKDLNAHVVSKALDAVAATDEALLTVKLHPGDGDWHYVRQIVQDHPVHQRVTIRHREPLAPLLHQSTVTWLHRSSVALESLAAGVPVVVIASNSPSTADLELQRLALPIARTSGDLARITVALAQPAARATYFETRDIAAFVGPESAANCAAETIRMLATQTRS
jgi:hypothetical protein